MHIDRLIALAGSLPQSIQVRDFNVPSRVFDDSGLLQHMSNGGDAIAPHADHLGQEILSQMQMVLAREIMHAQQPARQSGFDGVQCITCGGLLRLRKESLFVSKKHGSETDALLGGNPQYPDLKRRSAAWQSNDRVRQ